MTVFAHVTRNCAYMPQMADGTFRHPQFNWRWTEEEKPYSWTPDVFAGVIDTTEPTFAAHCERCGWTGDDYNDPESPEQDALWHRCQKGN